HVRAWPLNLFDAVRDQLCPSAAKAIRKLDKPTARPLLNAVGTTADDPRPAGCIQLKDGDGELRIVATSSSSASTCSCVLVQSLGRCEDGLSEEFDVLKDVVARLGPFPGAGIRVEVQEPSKADRAGEGDRE